MTLPLGSASCCRSMLFRCFPNLAEVKDHLRTDFSLALQDSTLGICRENLRFFSLLEPLPLSWDDWPEDSKAGCPRSIYEGPSGVPSFRRWRCKLVTPEGACSIYERRPYICSSFQPNGIECAFCSCYQDADGSCRPSESVS